MSTRAAAAWSAWSAWAICVALVALAELLNYLAPVVPGRDWFTEEVFAHVGVLWLTYPTIGAISVSRRPRNPIGWVFCAGELITIMTHCAGAYADYSLFALPARLPATTYAAWWSESGIVIAVVWLTTTLLLLLFPDGRPPSRSWWVVAWMAATGSVPLALWNATWPGPMYRYPSVESPFGLEGGAWAFVEGGGQGWLFRALAR
jgi:hypothetical protein